ncbi:MAG TPA: GYD domain-containing protein [Bradyrhizobium sp.]|uniref:GYD domain-containing protein n=1 Tax=Bradyrhizobium sp. TaxID=376 RepID=UPI002C584689|nr:GYD domain-containing protein [Bradyrhizobium sp.]HLZ01986.1 GYD domain-containing protein [Bradyrhizobium sp.]
MDTFIILSKYTSEGRKYATPEAARKRWTTIAASLEKTLGGKVLSHHVTMGDYDSVVIVTIQPNQDFRMFQCLNLLQQPGDVDITVMKAWDFDQFAPLAK